MGFIETSPAEYERHITACDIIKFTFKQQGLIVVEYFVITSDGNRAGCTEEISVIDRSFWAVEFIVRDIILRAITRVYRQLLTYENNERD